MDFKGEWGLLVARAEQSFESYNIETVNSASNSIQVRNSDQWPLHSVRLDSLKHNSNWTSSWTYCTICLIYESSLIRATKLRHMTQIWVEYFSVLDLIKLWAMSGHHLRSDSNVEELKKITSYTLSDKTSGISQLCCSYLFKSR